MPLYKNSFCLFKKDEIGVVSSGKKSPTSPVSAIIPNPNSSGSLENDANFSNGSGSITSSRMNKEEDLEHVSCGIVFIEQWHSLKICQSVLQVRLEIEYTDLDAKEERGVRKYILHKANRNLVYPYGQVYTSEFVWSAFCRLEFFQLLFLARRSREQQSVIMPFLKSKMCQ